MEDADIPDPSDQQTNEDDTSNPYEADALKYLKEHKILELFEQLTATLVYERPDDPRAFMKRHVCELQRVKQNPEDEPLVFIDESNIRSVFGMLDVTGKGHITLPQYKAAMESMAVKQFNPSPAGAELNKIVRETFVREAKAAVKVASATFSDY